VTIPKGGAHFLPGGSADIFLRRATAIAHREKYKTGHELLQSSSPPYVAITKRGELPCSNAQIGKWNRGVKFHVRLARFCASILIYLLVSRRIMLSSLRRLSQLLSLRDLFIREPCIINRTWFDHPRNQRRDNDRKQ
jgi:hypothetical protein